MNHKKKVLDADPLVVAPLARLSTVEMSMEEREAFLLSILASSTEYSIIANDLNYRILAWNEGAKRIYGYEGEEVLGKSSMMLHSQKSDTGSKIKNILIHVLQKGIWEGMLTRVRKNGEEFEALVTFTLRKNQRGIPIGFTMISRDMTKQLALEKQTKHYAIQSKLAEEASHLKSQFLANVSHELRTPLNGIIGFTEIMLTEKMGQISSIYKDFLQDILTSARHLLQLIDDILDLEKIEAGKIEFKPELIDLKEIVAQVVDNMYPLARKKNIKLTAQIDKKLTQLFIDPGKLKQILYNYVSNAIKFTPENGKVDIEINAIGDNKFEIVVRDTGIGIQAKDIPKLFKEFQQLDNSPAKKYPGTGLGLVLTKRLVELQKGEIDVESIFGEGSTFYATLPIKQSGENS